MWGWNGKQSFKKMYFLKVWRNVTLELSALFLRVELWVDALIRAQVPRSLRQISLGGLSKLYKVWIIGSKQSNPWKIRINGISNQVSTNGETNSTPAEARSVARTLTVLKKKTLGPAARSHAQGDFTGGSEVFEEWHEGKKKLNEMHGVSEGK